ncbi:calcium-binding protein [Agrobacterium tumefaciens]|uniref:Calcium-binding protein n=1 Tax=Rhizobium rhizogenes TaxID=359 RepID=A0AA92C2C0_RHIRH|nr:calcium-binding protein [Rhizobium rhizogenes]PVE63598.1 calcium-binding protein [Agrobacterium tumefaciens]PVE72489.1 calcium-binding protein [Sphingomonas sp. TPD3009]
MLIFLQLRSVLGRRTGNEKPPFDPFSAREAAKVPIDDNKVVTLPKRGETEENRFAAVDAVAAPGTALNDSLRQLVETDPSFQPKEFLNGARMAYEMIVMAFADGDRDTLKNLLSKDVYDGFDAAITEREKRGEVVKSTFVGIERIEMTQAAIRDSEEQITLRIISQLISATYDKDGKLVDGDAENVSEVDDIWTFSRDIRSRDPNWKLIATESEA